MKDGILLINKEEGYTSFDVIAKLRGILKTKKLGHTGTLDPDATGVLPVCIGKATRLADMFSTGRKEYIAEMMLGVSTDTMDISGSLTDNLHCLKTGEFSFKNVFGNITDDMIMDTMFSFKGEYMQIPPMYSALKHNGKKLHELAREGIVVERQPRKMMIYEIEPVFEEGLVQINNKTGIPDTGKRIIFRVLCSKGTYVRALIDDIGNKLGCGACMSALKRTGSGDFKIKDCIRLDEAETFMHDNSIDEHIISIEECLKDIKSAFVKQEFDKLLFNGNKLYEEMFEVKGFNKDMDELPEEIKVYSSDGKFVGLYYRSDDLYRPKYMFL